MTRTKPLIDLQTHGLVDRGFFFLIKKGQS